MRKLAAPQERLQHAPPVAARPSYRFGGLLLPNFDQEWVPVGLHVLHPIDAVSHGVV